MCKLGMPTGDEQGNRMSSDRGKQELQQALLDLLREDPDILNNVVSTAVLPKLKGVVNKTRKICFYQTGW